MAKKKTDQLKPFNFKKGGPSPNPGGRPRAHKEMVLKLRAQADYIADCILALIHKGMTGTLTMSDKILSAHLWETWQAMFGRHPQSILLSGGLDIGDDINSPSGTAGLSALLLRAQYEKTDEYKQAHALIPPEEIPLAAEPQKVSSLQLMRAALQSAKPNDALASEREVLESLLGKDRTDQLIASAAVIVDSTGEAIATKPDPAPAPSTPPPEPEATAVPLAPPEAASEAEPPPKPKAKWSGAPAGFRRAMEYKDGEFLNAAQTRDQHDDMVRRQTEARANPSRYPGGQIPLSELKPDPVSPHEVVRFTLAPGGRVKRC